MSSSEERADASAPSPSVGSGDELRDLPTSVDSEASVDPEAGEAFRDLTTRTDSEELDTTQTSSGAATPRLSVAVGDRLGDYVLTEQLGAGGQGAVFVGSHASLGVRHAVKVLRFVDERRAERFAREARALAKLDRCDGVVRVFQYDVLEGGRAYFASELIEGGRSVADLLQSGPLPVLGAVRLAEGMARALAHIHAAGIVHRDLKPANVLLSGASDVPVLSDFGLARDQEEERMTSTHSVIGSRPYMAPEQLGGDQARVGPHSDVFALGILLFEMLTGRRPFQAPSLAEMGRAVREDPAPAPSSLRRQVGPDLDRVVLRALEKDPGRRPTAAELAETLARVARDEGVERSGRRPRRLLAWVGLLAMPVAVGAVGHSSLRARAAELEALEASPEVRTTRRFREAVRASSSERATRLQAFLAEQPEDVPARVALESLQREARTRRWVAALDAGGAGLEALGKEDPRHPLALAVVGLGRRERRAQRRIDVLETLDVGERIANLKRLQRTDPSLAWAGQLAVSLTPWHERKTRPRPPRSSGHLLVYDPRRREVVLLVDGGDASAELWTWNGARWAKLEAGPGPRKVRHGAMAYDGKRERLVVFTPQGETWELEGSAWRRRRPTTSPSARERAAMTYDPERGVVVLFGGRSEGSALDDTWVWHGTHWTRLEPQVRPSPRWDHAMVYDAQRKAIVLHGGRSREGAWGDTWTWAAPDWARIRTTGSPPPSAGHGLAYDGAGGGVILFGGRGDPRSGGTWFLSGSRWEQRAPYGEPTSKLRDHAMAWDDHRKRIVLFGGERRRNRATSDTWEYGE